MFVWSKRLVAALLGLFVLTLGVFFLNTAPVNYLGLIIWVFVWMIDQARMRGKNVWIWLIPFVLIPLPTLMLFVLFLQRRIRPS